MTADKQPAIDVTGLACSYQDFKVLEGVSFSVEPAEIFFIVGGTGVGKTTLLRNLVGPCNAGARGRPIQWAQFHGR